VPGEVQLCGFVVVTLSGFLLTALEFVCKQLYWTFWRESLFTGLDYWTGLLDWTAGLAQNGIKCLLQPFQCIGEKLIMFIQPSLLP